MPKTVHYYIAMCPRPETFGRREQLTQELVWTTLFELEALAFKMRTQKAIVRAALLSN